MRARGASVDGLSELSCSEKKKRPMRDRRPKEEVNQALNWSDVSENPHFAALGVEVRALRTEVVRLKLELLKGKCVCNYGGKLPGKTN
jgi:hypothetical protein